MKENNSILLSLLQVIRGIFKAEVRVKYDNTNTGRSELKFNTVLQIPDHPFHFIP